MKKAFLMFCMAMSLFATNAFAQLQEVRGVETRRVEYTGNFYQNGKIHTANTTMYGWEFHNANSIKVSVDIELCYTDKEVLKKFSLSIRTYSYSSSYVSQTNYMIFNTFI